MPTFYFVSPNPVTLSQPIDVNSVMNEALGTKTFPNLPLDYEFGLHDNFQDAYTDCLNQNKNLKQSRLIIQVRGPAFKLTQAQQEQLALKEDDDVVEMWVKAAQYPIVSVYDGKKRLFNIESPYTLNNIQATSHSALHHTKQFVKNQAFALSLGATVFSLALAFSANSFYMTALKWGVGSGLALGFSFLLCLGLAVAGYSAGKMIWKGLHQASHKQKSAKKAKSEPDLAESLEAGMVDPSMTHVLVSNPIAENPLYSAPDPMQDAAFTTGSPLSSTPGRSDDIDWDDVPLATMAAPSAHASVTAEPAAKAPILTAAKATRTPKYVDVLEPARGSTEIVTTNSTLLRLLKQIAELEREVNFGEKHNVVLAFSRAIRDEPEEEIQIKIAEKALSLLQGFRTAYQDDVKAFSGRRDNQPLRRSWNRAKDEKQLIADLEKEVSNLNARSIYSM